MASNVIHRAKEALGVESPQEHLEDEDAHHGRWVIDERSVFDNPLNRHNVNRKILPNSSTTISQEDLQRSQAKLDQVRSYFDDKLATEYRINNNNMNGSQIGKMAPQQQSQNDIQDWISKGQSLPLSGLTGSDDIQQTNTIEEMIPFTNETVAPVY